MYAASYVWTSIFWLHCFLCKLHVTYLTASSLDGDNCVCVKWSCCEAVLFCFVVMVVLKLLPTTVLTSASRPMLLLHSSISESCLTYVRMTTWCVFEHVAHCGAEHYRYTTAKDSSFFCVKGVKQLHEQLDVAWQWDVAVTEETEMALHRTKWLCRLH